MNEKYSIDGLVNRLDGIYNLLHLLHNSNDEDEQSFKLMSEVLLFDLEQTIKKLREI